MPLRERILVKISLAPRFTGEALQPSHLALRLHDTDLDCVVSREERHRGKMVVAQFVAAICAIFSMERQRPSSRSRYIICHQADRYYHDLSPARRLLTHNG